MLHLALLLHTDYFISRSTRAEFIKFPALALHQVV